MQPENSYSQGKNRSIDSIPPTKAALKEHVKRAVYQGGLQGHVVSLVVMTFTFDLNTL